MTTKDDIRRWLERGKEDGATHLIVVCDTYDHVDFPVYVLPGQDARKVMEGYNGHNMQRVMEVYNLSMDWNKQLSEHRSFNF